MSVAVVFRGANELSQDARERVEGSRYAYLEAEGGAGLVRAQMVSGWPNSAARHAFCCSV